MHKTLILNEKMENYSEIEFAYKISNVDIFLQRNNVIVLSLHLFCFVCEMSSSFKSTQSKSKFNRRFVQTNKHQKQLHHVLTVSTIYHMSYFEIENPRFAI